MKARDEVKGIMKRKEFLIIFIAAGCFLFNAATGRAAIPEPDNIVYGAAMHGETAII